MKIAKTILPIAIIGLLLAVPLVPAKTVSEEPEAEPNPIIGKVGVMWVPENVKDTVFEEVEVTEQDIIDLQAAIDDFKQWFTDNRPFSDLRLTENEKAEMTERLENIFTILFIPGFGIFMPQLFALLCLAELIRGNTFFSIGLGRGIMPYTIYEAGLRFIIPFLYPIRLLQFRGYTAYLKVLPGIQYGDKSHTHLVTARSFRGLYIDGASLLTERIMGPTLAIGNGYLTVWGWR